MIWAVFISLLCYAAISGIKDAILYSRKGADALDINEHIIFTLERITIGLLVIGATSLTTMEAIMSCVCGLFCFSLIHNGFYYEGRKVIDKAYDGFFDDSTTSSAKFELQLAQRLLLFIMGLIIFIAYAIS